MKNVDFCRNPMQGQLHPTERKALYEEVVRREPKTMLEIGTWKGGGSTYILSSAASIYGGFLYTIEEDMSFYCAARQLYDTDLRQLNKHVGFFLGKSLDLIPIILRNIRGLDFVLFDGAEDAEQTVREYNALKDVLFEGSFIACHDWCVKKMRLLKEILEADKTWRCILTITNTETGFAIWERIG